MREEEKILSPEFLDEIRRVREQRGISVEEVAEKTNIKLEYIKAIESGDLGRLPGGIYNRAFIRSYSEFLGINTKPYERKVESDEMLRERQVKVELGRPQNASMPSKLTIIGCLFTVFFLYSFFYGPRSSKKEIVEDQISALNDQQVAKAKKQIAAAKTPEEKEDIRSELQARISDDASLLKKIPEVSPIKKNTQEIVSKELVVTLMARNNVKVVVKDYYGNLLVNKAMTPNEAIMLNGTDEYYMAADNMKNLDIYLDGVQIRDLSKVEKRGNTYTLRAEKLVGIAEAQPYEKGVTRVPVFVSQPEAAAEPSANAVPATIAATQATTPATEAKAIKQPAETTNNTANQNVDQSANKPQNNQQGSGR